VDLRRVFGDGILARNCFLELPLVRFCERGLAPVEELPGAQARYGGSEASRLTELMLRFGSETELGRSLRYAHETFDVLFFLRWRGWARLQDGAGHGKNTGALRPALTRFLSHRPFAPPTQLVRGGAGSENGNCLFTPTFSGIGKKRKGLFCVQ
jgi:hypothetical protein